MRKSIIPLSLLLVFVAFVFSSQLKAGGNQPGTGYSYMLNSGSDLIAETGKINASETVFDSLKLNDYGLNIDAFNCAVKGYENLLNKGEIKNPDIITICDFSQSSLQKRLYVIDVKNYQLLMNTYVAHGKNSGAEFAKYFSNNQNSHKSSLGFYITGDTYTGEHGLSLRINGLDLGFNDRAYARSIVVHGSDYVGNDRAHLNTYMGRSYGCPAVPALEINKLVNTIKNGTCLFIYHPTKKYLEHSKLLNS